ncbi:MAG: RNA polymerase sigma factor [Capsulimonadaceae bacterium]
MEIPNFIDRLSVKPGTDWSASEIELAKDWWSERTQLEVLWYYAARYLGSGATDQDAEDAVMEFYTLFDGIRVSYEPGGPSFFSFAVHSCFRNHCVRLGDSIRRRHDREARIDIEHEEDLLTLQIVDEGPASDPMRRAESAALAEDLNLFLKTKRLPRKQRQAFFLRYIEGMSYETIAVTMNSPLGSVKGWLSRATASARDYLHERGWS